MRPNQSVLIVHFLVCLAGMLPSQTWIQQNPPASPALRRAGAMAFDAANNRLILHGGTSPGPGVILAETWSYNGTWTLLNPATPAPGRWGHRLVRDTRRNRLVTFGGRSPGINDFANDTFAWTGSDWVELSTPNAPSARFLYGLCYDGHRDRVVLFGGRTAVLTVGDTWEFDGTTWTAVSLPTSPAPREEMVLVYDEGRATAVLFGGYDRDGDLLYGDTWEYDGRAWREAAPTTSPSPRFRASAAYDSRRHRPVVYGGSDGALVLTDTHEYTGNEWVAVAVGPGSAQATETYAGFDAQRNRFVTFGGVGSSFSNETWEFQGASTALFAAFGSGCPTSAGTATLTAVTPPVLGTQFDMQITGMPAATGFVLVAQGFSNATWNNNPLPLDLAPLGLGGCWLEVAADALVGVGATGATATFGFLVPNTASLSNQDYYVQVFVPDAASASGIGGLSRPGRAVFGT